MRAGADQIVFAEGVGGTITLASTLPTITDGAGLAIDGGGDVTVSGNDSVRVFEVQSGARLSLSKLTITDGITNEFSSGIQPGLGGGIHNVGTLTVTNSTLSGNIAGSGGAIANDGGTLTVANATIFSNHAANGGGGIRNGILNSGTITLMNSTVSENTSSGGGGVLSGRLGSAVKVIDSTISNNRVSASGGGIGIFDAGTLEVTNSTISGNSATFRGSGIHLVDNSVGATLRSSIVANNTSGDNCSLVTTLTDGGYNVDDDGTCGFTQATGSLPNTDPLLDPDGLRNNGGPTKTIALQPESPAVDLVGQDACPPPNTDQRGVARPQGAACDSGAYELVHEPKSKADCKWGGYEEFGFKNQGQCIASLRKKTKG